MLVPRLHSKLSCPKTVILKNEAMKNLGLGPTARMSPPPQTLRFTQGDMLRATFEAKLLKTV